MGKVNHFTKGRFVTLGTNICVLTYCIDQWCIMPTHKEPAGMFFVDVETAPGATIWVACNLIHTVWEGMGPTLKALIEEDIPVEKYISEDDMANMYAAFVYSFTGINKFNHVETKSIADGERVQCALCDNIATHIKE